MRLRQRAIVPALAIALIVATTEIVSLLAIRISRPFLDEEIRSTRAIFREQSERMLTLLEPDSSRLLVLDSLLGWRYRAGYKDARNTMNAQGLRSTQEYTSQPSPNVIRVAAFGDSFVYGNEVADNDAWSAQIERMSPTIELLNYGVGGYGVDQAYLRFCREGMVLSPHVVIIGFATDDLRRVVNVYRRFISNREIPLVKPRFVFGSSGELVLEPNPAPHPWDYERYLRSPRSVIELGEKDQWYSPIIYANPLYDYSATVRLATNVWLRLYRRYVAQDRLYRRGQMNPSSMAFRIQGALFERFAAAVEAAGARPLVVILPDRYSVTQARQGRTTLFAPLTEHLASRGLDYVDLTNAFLAHEPQSEASDLEDWFMSGGHYSPTGNRIVAAWLEREILARQRALASHTPHAASRLTASLDHACPRMVGQRAN